MTASLAPVLRTGLHLVLALAMLLQAGMAAAMGTRGNTDGVAVESAMAATTTPPCHGDIAPEAVAAEALQPASHDCCGDESGALGQLCQWACAQAVSLRNESWALAARHLPLPQPPALVVAAPRWPVATPLRPPIA